GYAYASDGRIRSSRADSAEPPFGDGHNHDAHFGGSSGRRGALPGTGDHGLSLKTRPSIRVAGGRRPSAWGKTAGRRDSLDHAILPTGGLRSFRVLECTSGRG